MIGNLFKFDFNNFLLLKFLFLEKDDDFNHDSIVRRLKTKGRDGDRMITYVDFLFSPAVYMLFTILNMKFIFKRGHPAYNRIKLYGIIMYAHELNVYTLTGVSYLCRNDEVLKCFTNGITPSPNCLDEFLTKSNRLIMKSISICTLVELNDLGCLDFRRIYCDSTDAKINGSINYKVKLDDLKCFKLLNKWNLLHNGNAKKMNKNRKKLEKLLKTYENDEEMVKYIKHALNNYSLYRKNAYRKYDVFKKYLDDDPEGYVCVMFPEARFMKTKRGRFEFALLIQQCMLRNGIVLPGLLQSEPNDGKALNKIIIDLKETFQIMEKLQKYYGERRNYKEIRNALEIAIRLVKLGVLELLSPLFIVLVSLEKLFNTKFLSPINNSPLHLSIISLTYILGIIIPPFYIILYFFIIKKRIFYFNILFFVRFIIVVIISNIDIIIIKLVLLNILLSLIGFLFILIV